MQHYEPEFKQIKIAQTLDTVTGLLTMRKKQLSRLDKLIQSGYYDMFGDPVTNKKGWEKLMLSELGNWVSGGTPPGNVQNILQEILIGILPGNLMICIKTFD